MEKYEKTISLKSIWISIVRRWHIFFIIFIPIGLISYVVTDKLLTKTYISSVSISRGAAVSTAQFSTIQSYVQNTSSDKDKPGAIYLTVENLKNEGFKHKNGSEITISEISSGLSFTSINNNSTPYVTFSFESTDETIVQKVLDVLAENTVYNLKTTGGSDYTKTEIYKTASPAKKNSKERTYFLIALAAGFVVAFGIPFVDEIVSDEVYDKYDIEALGCSAFEVKAKPKKKEA